MTTDPELATWLLLHRTEIDRSLRDDLGDRAPAAGAPESEALRRFRSFAVAGLRRGRVAPPALDGLRVDAARVRQLIERWCEAAARVAATGLDGPCGGTLRQSLAPLAQHFGTALRGTAPARDASGPPRTGRRAVSAAIDRLADAFLAIDVDSGRIVDTNPAAGSLLGVERNALLAADALGFVPAPWRPAWTAQLDAVAEGAEAHRFRSQLLDAHGGTVDVEARVTRYATRERTLALVLARPLA